MWAGSDSTSTPPAVFGSTGSSVTCIHSGSGFVSGSGAGSESAEAFAVAAARAGEADRDFFLPPLRLFPFVPFFLRDFVEPPVRPSFGMATVIRSLLQRGLLRGDHEAMPSTLSTQLPWWLLPAA